LSQISRRRSQNASGGKDDSGPLRREILVSGTAQQKYFFAKARRNWQARAAYSAGATNPALAPYKAILKQMCVRFNGNRRGLTMHGQRNLTHDAVLGAQIVMASRLIAEQSAAIARAHSAIERAMETLRGPDGRSDLSC
jgi:hypothetical protein